MPVLVNSGQELAQSSGQEGSTVPSANSSQAFITQENGTGETRSFRPAKDLPEETRWNMGTKETSNGFWNDLCIFLRKIYCQAIRSRREMKRILVVAMVLAAVALWHSDLVYAQGAGGGHLIKKNQAGGVSGGSARGFKGEDAAGGSVTQFATDGNGNAEGGNVKAFKGPNAAGARAGVTTRKADGSVQHQSGMAATGQQGTVSSSGSYSKDASGNRSGERSTTATSTSGASAQGQTTYSGGDVTHTTTCYDAKGNAVACPKKQ
jgi:hypothetical protein